MKSLSYCLTIFLVLYMSSCIKTDQENFNPITEDNGLKLEKDLGDLFDYTNHNLEIMGKAVLSSSINQPLRELIYREIEKKFDGDYNVLLKTLDNHDEIDFSLAASINNVISTNNSRITPNEVIKAFTNIEGNTYYPQLYIPFYEDLKAKKVLGAKEPILIVYDGRSKDVFEGFTLRAGKIQKLNQQVDESFAKNNEVWVISLNERVNDEKGISGHNASKTVGTSYDYAKWERVKVTCYKESWVSGGSEVCMKAVISNIDGFFRYYNGISWVAEESFTLPYNVYGGAFRIRDFTRSEISNGAIITDISLAFAYVSNDPTLTIPSFHNIHPCGSHFWYIIYEDDNWPVGNRYRDITSSAGRTYTIEYRSADDEYHSGIMNAYSNLPGSVDFYNVANGCIEFKTKVIP